MSSGRRLGGSSWINIVIKSENYSNNDSLIKTSLKTLLAYGLTYTPFSTQSRKKPITQQGSTQTVTGPKTS